MKSFHRLSFLLLVSVLFLQCKKNREPEPVTISGNVSDNIQGIPVANANIQIKYQQAASNSVFNSGFISIASTTTDANGNYSVTFTPESPITYKIIVDKAYYFSKESQVSADVASAGTNTTVNFGIDPLGWLKVNVKNLNPHDVNDNIIYQNTSESSACSSCCNNSPVSLDGMTIDTFFICQRVAAPAISYSWFVTKNGNTNPFTGSTTAIIGDTVVVNINY